MYLSPPWPVSLALMSLPVLSGWDGHLKIILTIEMLINMCRIIIIIFFFWLPPHNRTNNPGFKPGIFCLLSLDSLPTEPIIGCIIKPSNCLLNWPFTSKQLEMLLIPNALCWSSRKCNCACALPAEVQLRLRITRRSWQKLFAGKNFGDCADAAAFIQWQQRAFGNSNICNCLHWNKRSRTLVQAIANFFLVNARWISNLLIRLIHKTTYSHSRAYTYSQSGLAIAFVIKWELASHGQVIAKGCVHVLSNC